MKTRTTPSMLTKSLAPIRDLLNHSSWWRRITVVPLAVGLACFALLPVALGVSPPPDGGYPNDNTAEGEDALLNLSGGYGNTAIGNAALFSTTTANDNTATGGFALFDNTTGDDNTASGFDALALNTTGSFNTANGSNALFNNTTGTNNTATGFQALHSNTSANNNTATGYTALFTNTTGGSNTADGFAALYSNTTGNYNAANGYAALYGNTTGGYNTANGYAVLYKNVTGGNNTGAGFKALFSNTTGGGNTADGLNALYKNTTGSSNTAVGLSALYYNTSGNSNIALGSAAGVNLTTGSYNIDIGNAGVAGEANTIRIGTAGTHTKTFIAGISGAAVINGVGVIVNSNGQLGTVVSSERFKDAIKPMDRASEVILALRPVTFRYKHELDPAGIPQFGLVAEEVEKVNPDLVARDEQGKPYTVRYDAVNAMLLNEFLKEHQTVQELKKEVAELTTGLQKVSAQLELNKRAPQTASNNH